MNFLSSESIQHNLPKEAAEFFLSTSSCYEIIDPTNILDDFNCTEILRMVIDEVQGLQGCILSQAGYQAKMLLRGDVRDLLVERAHQGFNLICDCEDA